MLFTNLEAREEWDPTPSESRTDAHQPRALLMGTSQTAGQSFLLQPLALKDSVRDREWGGL